ncbi:MAG: AAA family ATPase [Actinomycetia bacterium]|nr:AAA family ATPase [Actinomycetes bacterium]
MHLRSLRLRGFKSFPEPVELQFEPGVSIVVGPNGSGKSNVADAIVWAAGSLSPSRLRAEKPDDVLFTGGSSTPPARSCEVELVFDNADGAGPLPFSELSVARRLHRDGEGQYLINRSTVRRLDVLEVLAEAGLGSEMHAIISQGQVEAVLASKPADRRALVEEAAGLGTFKQRRHRAGLKLARVQGDVERARDLEVEVKKRLRPLRLQATAAERAEKLRDTIEQLREHVDRSALARLDKRIGAVEERRAAAGAAKGTADASLETLLEERRRVEHELEQAVGRHEQATAALYRLRSALERLSLRHELADEAARSLAEDAQRLAQRAGLPSDTRPLQALGQAEQALESAAQAAREALERREALEAALRIGEERLRSLDGSLAEREGLAPAARALADEGRQIAVAVLQVDSGYERAAAAALGWRGSAVLVERASEGAELLERARRDGLGPLGVLLETASVRPGSEAPPVAGAERLIDHVCPAEGGEHVRALLAGVWVVPLAQLSNVGAGVAVTVEGHCHDADRGELWFEGETARSVLMSQEARRRELEVATASLREEAFEARETASRCFEEERAARERRARAQQAAAQVPQPVDPDRVALLAALAEQAARLRSGLAEALSRAKQFEVPLRAHVEAGGTRTGELGAELRQLGAREAELRRTAAEAQEHVSAISVEAAQLGVERRELLARLPEGAVGEALSEEEEHALRVKLERSERRLEELGQVNPLAAEEYAREQERLSELTEQREDLERAVHDLIALCDELTETVERRFAETFTAVGQHFVEVSAALFPGGGGRLRLSEEEGEDEPGIEVELRLAGKRITRLSLLSGGEKALGALSFLFALFLARPSPFYLLDEVEAALDDTNIGRFVELLRRFADRAQFIVVTHQKHTMDAADVLYGVTMGKDGVSQVVSRRMRAPAEVATA